MNKLQHHLLWKFNLPMKNANKVAKTKGYAIKTTPTIGN